MRRVQRLNSHAVAAFLAWIIEQREASGGVVSALKLGIESSSGQIDEGVNGLLSIGTGCMNAQNGALR